jgi:hypothetical protein
MRVVEQRSYPTQVLYVLSVGDLDPSGVHMPRALAEDVAAFAAAHGGRTDKWPVEAERQKEHGRGAIHEEPGHTLRRPAAQSAPRCG